MTSPIRPTDDDARILARSLIDQARFGALAVLETQTNAPMVSRVAVVPGPDGLPMSLVSDLSQHTQALKANPICSLLIGEPEEKGDPLTHPRLTLQATASFVRHGDAQHNALTAHYLRHQPKAKLYVGFGDFSFLLFQVTAAFLNGGFGRAYTLEPTDLVGQNST